MYAWDYSELSPTNHLTKKKNVRYEHDIHFVFSRFHPNNQFHQIHDDVIPLYHLIKRFKQDGAKHRLLVMDSHEKTHSSRIYDELSDGQSRYREYLDIDPTVITCFKDAVFGANKDPTWYDYGLKSPQGPIPDKIVNGNLVRGATEYLISKLNLDLGSDELRVKGNDIALNLNSNGDFAELDTTILLSRKSTRLIINEEELATNLKRKFGYNVIIVSNEEYTYEQQVKLLRRARIVVGMHGALLTMAAFCRRATVLVEMFPFGVPAVDYTPYKTMAELHGMDLVYRAWENKISKNSVAYPDREPLEGGISFMSAEDKNAVLETIPVPQHKCCDNPFWLYRIFQDTRVDIIQVLSLVEDALKESRLLLAKINDKNWVNVDIFPARIKKITCLDGSKRSPGELWAEWDVPFNVDEVSRYSIMVENTKREYHSKGSMMSIAGFEKGEEVIFLVRPIVGEVVGEFGAVGRCIV